WLCMGAGSNPASQPIIKEGIMAIWTWIWIILGLLIIGFVMDATTSSKWDDNGDSQDD
ncbi:hypothetical protein LCGC14_1992420, partial [marine sediment metagenome]